MPLPYKEASPSFAAFIQHVEEVGQKLASTANMNVGEGKQDAPVGTTLALIEQGLQIFSAIYKRIFRALKEEFKLIFEINKASLDVQKYAALMDLQAPGGVGPDGQDITAEVGEIAQMRPEQGGGERRVAGGWLLRQGGWLGG